MIEQHGACGPVGPLRLQGAPRKTAFDVFGDWLRERLLPHDETMIV